MYRKILVGYDASDQAKDALALGKQLADLTGADLVVAGVFQFDPVWGGFDPHFRDAEADYAREIEEAAASVDAEPEAYPSSSPARGLHELAAEIAADLIVVGSAHHGRVGQVLAGSVGVALLHGSPCAVSVAPRGYREHAGKAITMIAVGFDGSPESDEALAAASELALAASAKLRLVSVAVPPERAALRSGVGWEALLEAIQNHTRDQLAEAERRVPEGIEVEASLLTGDPADALAEVATSPGTLLVVGSRGYGPLRRVLLGSVSARLVRSAASPLLVTPRGMHETTGVTGSAHADATS
jgi:nucleotide-binding universal stress UspA family protein